jgi:hypothetical protein
MSSSSIFGPLNSVTAAVAYLRPLFFLASC